MVYSSYKNKQTKKREEEKHMSIVLDKPLLASDSFVYYTKNKTHARKKTEIIKCWEIRYAYLPELVGGSFHMQKGLRPVLIVSNDKNNKFSTNVHVIPFTTKGKAKLPTHVDVESELERKSTLLAECETQIPDCYVYEKIGEITDKNLQKEIQKAVIIQHGILSTIG